MKDFSGKIIPSIVDYSQFCDALNSDCERVNIMVGNINNLKEMILELHKKAKKAFVHIEMISGIGRDKDAVRFMCEQFDIDGIITTKSQIILAAKAQKVPCVQRIFAIDSAALKNAFSAVASCLPDEVELMPGLMPKIIRETKEAIKRPLIVGGLLKTAEEAKEAFLSGADYVSTGCKELWNIKI